MTQEQIWHQLHTYTVERPGPDLLAISGGNPGLYDLSKIVIWWHTQERSGNGHPPSVKKVLVETQGSRWQPWFTDVDLLTMSPKAPSSGLTPDASFDAFRKFVQTYNNDAGRYYAGHQAILKVVVFDEDDYLFARALHNNYPQFPFHLSVGTAMGGLTGRWVPPGRTVPTIDGVIDDEKSLLRRYRWLAERAMTDDMMADAKIQVQLHALLWGTTTKGV